VLITPRASDFSHRVTSGSSSIIESDITNDINSVEVDHRLHELRMVIRVTKFADS
jgi:hypothetical protein